jgi:endonuclease YncB( thermonuclease family)
MFRSGLQQEASAIVKGRPTLAVVASRRLAPIARVWIAAVSAVVAVAPAAADEALCLDGPSETVRAVGVAGAEEIVLGDGRRVRLAGVEAPVSLADTGAGARAAAERVASAARRALVAAVADRELRLLDLGEDRRGRRRGHLVDTETGHWVEGDLVGDGRLRVAPEPDDPVCAAALLAREAAARGAARGLWAEPDFAVRPADRMLLARVGDVVVAEGVVRSVGRSRGRVWLNFGDDIARDFAVVMNDNDRVRFERAGLVWSDLRGRRVRVRGVVARRGEGPRMAIDDPAVLEPVER